MKEKVVSFGRENSLIGIITFPDEKIEKKDCPVLIILNAGFLHRVGPFRLYVDLARKLAHLGFTVLRFDLSGIGDSASQIDSIDYEETVINDVRDAMDFVSAKKANNRFVLMGICTGADNSHKVAMSDERVEDSLLLPLASCFFKACIDIYFTCNISKLSVGYPIA